MYLIKANINRAIENFYVEEINKLKWTFDSRKENAKRFENELEAKKYLEENEEVFRGYLIPKYSYDSRVEYEPEVIKKPNIKFEIEYIGEE